MVIIALLLYVNNLHTTLFTHIGEVKAVRGISFQVEQGDILGIVGESGSGKSVTSLSIMGLVDDPGRIVEGSITFDGKDLAKLSQRELNEYRGRDIAMIFQDPMTSLNPVFSIKDQITTVLLKHTSLTKEEALKRAIELLKLVEIPEPKE